MKIAASGRPADLRRAPRRDACAVRGNQPPRSWLGLSISCGHFALGERAGALRKRGCDIALRSRIAMPSGGLCAALTAQRVPARGGREPSVRTAPGRATWAEVGVGGRAAACPCSSFVGVVGLQTGSSCSAGRIWVRITIFFFLTSGCSQNFSPLSSVGFTSGPHPVLAGGVLPLIGCACGYILSTGARE